LTLIEKGELTAKELTWVTNIPESRIYEVLNRLETEGWITRVEEGRPKKFKARAPNEVLRMIKMKKQAELDKLEREITSILQPLYDKTSKTERPDVWIIRGEENIISKAKSMIGEAEKTVFIAFPNIKKHHIDLFYPILRILKEKGIQIKFLVSSDETEHLEKLKKIAEVRVQQKLFGGGVIIDSKEVMIMLPDPVLGIWSDHAGLARVAAGYFEYAWK